MHVVYPSVQLTFPTKSNQVEHIASLSNLEISKKKTKLNKKNAIINFGLILNSKGKFEINHRYMNAQYDIDRYILTLESHGKLY